MRWCALVFLLACGDDAPDATFDAAVVDSDGFMGCPADTPELQPNAQARGPHVLATVVAASRVPARRYLNDWTFEFSDLKGTTLEDVTVVSARTWMPVHGHDGLVMPRILPTLDPRQIQVRGLNFNMRGPWEVQLSLRSGAGTDDLVFHVCIAE